MVVKKKRVGSPGDHFPSLLSNLSKLQTRDKFTDVVFHCDGGSVGAHKAFLGPLSPLLSSMFELSTRFQARRIRRREKLFLFLKIYGTFLCEQIEPVFSYLSSQKRQ